jgi:hypothetical protein
VAGQDLAQHALLLGMEARDAEAERRLADRLGDFEVALVEGLVVVGVVGRVLLVVARLDAELREQRVAVDDLQRLHGGARRRVHLLVELRVAVALERAPLGLGDGVDRALRAVVRRVERDALAPSSARRGHGGGLVVVALFG